METPKVNTWSETESERGILQIPMAYASTEIVQIIET